jgi:small subunit ribosomal protein S7e
MAWARWRCADGWNRYLDSKDATSLEYKLDSFSSVYKRLTGKDVVFEFPVVQAE